MHSLSIAVTLIAGAVSVAMMTNVAEAKNAGAARLVIGNTIHEVDVVDGEVWDYFRRDGTGVSLGASGEQQPFTWAFSGGALCRTYSEPPVECATYEIHGNSGIETFVSGNDTGQERTPFEFIRGNAKGL